ncbi:hypothetical protein NNJEOMEG_01161 [Fundidesulfovibrio magnetotacticus]|uniref:ATPase AAA-type core domain-containing protein n=1 Tax=Fundidesulfovibrio magnetotacticus TaxID=2730080 RepID=A0A6V8LTC0_9BACT|nr:AAA family ATPase [Fundidesulfovibrio magnetotacticus]GFK93329.1 hypothetical protein NNJEOMEG_01161 [Fundidesulfovibrio magnetotacticus]
MRLAALRIIDFKAFRDAVLDVSPLEVLVGANGSGKSSVFELLRFVRDSLERDIPPEILPGFRGQFLYHPRSDDSRFGWQLFFQSDSTAVHSYEASVFAVPGRGAILSERVLKHPDGRQSPAVLTLIERTPDKVVFADSFPLYGVHNGKAPPNARRLTLSHVYDKGSRPLIDIRENIASWRFYASSRIDMARIKNPALVEQNASCEEDCGNLSAVLHHFMTEHPRVFDELLFRLGQVVPGFSGLTVWAYGSPGNVMAFWDEQGVPGRLSLGDLSEGTLRFLCWAAVLLHPAPPALVCLDEPDVGLHPRALPLLAALIKQASARMQIFVATHNSYFLSQFDLDSVTVLTKQDGQAAFRKPGESKTLLGLLEEFGPEELDNLHRSDELEVL